MSSDTRVDVVNLDSAFRVSGDVNDFNIQLAGTVKNVSKVVIDQVWFPDTELEGINHSNNTLILAQRDISRTYIHITTGAYTDATLATQIQTQLNDGTGVFDITTWTCTFAAGQYTIANTSALNFYVASDGLINTTLGFDNPDQVATTDSITGDGTTQLNSESYIIIRSKALNPFEGVPSLVEFARIVHTIDSGNNTIILDDQLIDPITITLTPGRYNLYELADLTQAAINTQAVASEAVPVVVEYRLNTATNAVDFIFRSSASVLWSGTFIKTFINYNISENAIVSAIKIYNPPLTTTNVLIINPAADTYDIGTIVVDATAFKWRRGAKAANSKLYFAPFSASAVMSIDTTTDTADTTSIAVGVAGDGFDTDLRWSDSILAPNGDIYFVPYKDRYWARLNPSTEVLNRDAVNTGFAGGIIPAWSGGVLVGSNIYTAPFVASGGVRILDTTTDTLNQTTDIGLVNDTPKYSAGAYVPSHNKIYYSPHWASNILVVDVGNADAISYITDPAIPTQGNGLFDPGMEQFSDIIYVEAVNKAYILPFGRNYCVVLDCATDPPTISTPPGLQNMGDESGLYDLFTLATNESSINTINGARKFSGGVLFPGNKIYIIPLLYNKTIIIDCDTDTFEFGNAEFDSSSNKWASGTLNDSFSIYEDTLRKRTSSHMVSKVHLHNPVGGATLTTPGTVISNYPPGYEISSIDMQVVDAYGNLASATSNYNLTISIHHA